MAHRNIERNERMRVLHANGWAIADLARTFGLTWASVDQIVNFPALCRRASGLALGIRTGVRALCVGFVLLMIALALSGCAGLGEPPLAARVADKIVEAKDKPARVVRYAVVALAVCELAADRAPEAGTVNAAMSACADLAAASTRFAGAIDGSWFEVEAHRARFALYRAIGEGLERRVSLIDVAALAANPIGLLPVAIAGVETASKIRAFAADAEALLRADPIDAESAVPQMQAIADRFVWNMRRLQSLDAAR